VRGRRGSTWFRYMSWWHLISLYIHQNKFYTSTRHTYHEPLHSTSYYYLRTSLGPSAESVREPRTPAQGSPLRMGGRRTAAPAVHSA
jgi:hypothetical protein